MFLLKLTTKITDEGIAFKYAPTMRQFKIYPWEQIASVSIVSYNPLQDFAGWGLKKSKKYGKGYTTKGNKGLWIQLTDSKAFFSPFLQRTKLVHTSRRKNFILFPETVIDVVKPHVVFIYASPSNVKSAYL